MSIKRREMNIRLHPPRIFWPKVFLGFSARSAVVLSRLSPSIRTHCNTKYTAYSFLYLICDLGSTSKEKSLKRFHSIYEASGRIENPVLTVGTFDGVHRGHRAIVEKLNVLADERGGSSALLTFSPHPKRVLQSDAKLKLITTTDEKLALLDRYGLQNAIVHPFTTAFSRIESTSFVRDFLVAQLGVRVLVVGHDHRFGRDRAGSWGDLTRSAARYGFGVEEVEAQKVAGVPVSSTAIREALAAGDLATANRLLGRDYAFDGVVVRGDGLGEKLGFPTANIRVPEEKLIPAIGIYATRIAYRQKTYGGMASIGYRPTLAGRDLRIEVHLFDFNASLYGESIRVSFVARMRDEIRFETLAALVQQLKRDREQALQLI